jgi:hypothetical protein
MDLWLFGVLQTTLEALDLTRGVNQALLAREKRVTCRAHVDVQGWLGRPRLPGVAAATRNCGYFVFRMYSRRHGARVLLCYERVHADALALFCRLFEPYLSVNQGKQGVIASYSNVAPRFHDGAALANQNRAGANHRTVTPFDA